MRDIFTELIELRHALGLIQCDTPGVQQLGNCVEHLADIAGKLAVRLEAVEAARTEVGN